MNSSNKSILIPSLSIWAVLAFGTFFPDELWGGHFLAFFPLPIKLVGLSISLLCILKLRVNSTTFEKASKLLMKNWAIYTSLLFALVFYFIPISFDYYGDAPLFMKDLKEVKNLDNKDILKHLFDFKVWNPNIGEKTVLCFVQLIANNIKFDFIFSFKVLGSLCAGLFLFNWINLIRITVTGRANQILLLLLGLSTPMLQIFQGHQEIYGPVLVSFVYFFIRLKKYNDNGSSKNLIWLIIALIVSIKMHITAVILIPVIFISILQLKGKFCSIKSVFTFLYLPFSILGLFAYFFILEDHIDPRFLEKHIPIEERLFLPLFAPDPPLDRYTLFSISHLKDLFNQSLIWSPLLLVFVSIIAYFRKQLNWKNPLIIQGVFLSACFISVYFLINPLLSMQLDWDLFSIPGIVILCSLVFIWNEIDKHSNTSQFITPVLGLSLFIIPTLLLNTSSSLIGERLISVGKNTFRGYWIGSIATLKNGLKAKNENKDFEFVINQLEQAGKDLEPYALKGKDREYSAIYSELGNLYSKFKKDHLKAKEYQEKSAEYYFENGDNLIALIESLFILKEYNKACIIAKSLVHYKYPTEEKSLSIAVHLSLEANQAKNALHYCKAYYKINPNKPLINHLIKELEAGTNPKLLAKNFRKK